ncbi:MAG: oligoendopeptidase F [Desulfuromonas sp.]|nr:MAG: oligoendopeptidase F [Desulfuromonas sp.]
MEHQAEPKWNLQHLYRGVDDPQLEKDLNQAQKCATAFRTRFHGNIAGETEAQELGAALSAYEAIHQQALKPMLYAQLLFSCDSRVAESAALLAQVREMGSRIEQETLFFDLELQKIPEEILATLLQSKVVKCYGHYLRQIRMQIPYACSEEVEQTLSRKNLSGRDGFVQLFDELTSSLSFSFTMPEESEERLCSGEELLSLLYHPEATLRERAFATFLEGHADLAIPLTACFNNLLLDHGQEAELRGYPELMTPTLIENETESAMVTQMMAVTEQNRPLAQRYFRLKKELLGLKSMKNSDLYAPLGSEGPRYPFTAALEKVREAFAVFSPSFVAMVDDLVTSGRVDVPARPGKSPGAYCMGMWPGEAPYVLLNHTGTLRDLSTLAHELGHAIHYQLAEGQQLLHYHPTLPLAETASVFGEMLLTRHMLDHEPKQELRIGLLCSKIEEIIATTFRQDMLTRFELAIHTRRGDGLLSPEAICDLWWEENAQLFGEAVSMIPAYRWGWAYISHFIHARFYCYSYVFGELLVLALFQRYREEGEAFIPLYEGLLKGGGGASPQTLLEPLGVNLSDPDFWQKGYDCLATLIDELEGLLVEKDH